MKITDMTLLGLVRAMDAGEVTSVEATEATLKETEEKKDLGAYVTVCAERALEEAKAADARRRAGERLPLLGVPIAVKDNICTEGVRTTCASRFLENYVPPYDAFVVKRAEERGRRHGGQSQYGRVRDGVGERIFRVLPR